MKRDYLIGEPEEDIFFLNAVLSVRAHAGTTQKSEFCEDVGKSCPYKSSDEGHDYSHLITAVLDEEQIEDFIRGRISKETAKSRMSCRTERFYHRIGIDTSELSEYPPLSLYQNDIEELFLNAMDKNVGGDIDGIIIIHKKPSKRSFILSSKGREEFDKRYRGLIEPAAFYYQDFSGMSGDIDGGGRFAARSLTSHYPGSVAVVKRTNGNVVEYRGGKRRRKMVLKGNKDHSKSKVGTTRVYEFDEHGNVVRISCFEEMKAWCPEGSRKRIITDRQMNAIARIYREVRNI